MCEVDVDIDEMLTQNDKLEAMLCFVLSNMPVVDIAKLSNAFADDHGVTYNDLTEWWAAHQIEDLHRRKREKLKTDAARFAKEALMNLRAKLYAARGIIAHSDNEADCAKARHDETTYMLALQALGEDNP